MNFNFCILRVKLTQLKISWIHILVIFLYKRIQTNKKIFFYYSYNTIHRIQYTEYNTQNTIHIILFSIKLNGENLPFYSLVFPLLGISLVHRHLHRRLIHHHRDSLNHHRHRHNRDDD